MTGASVWLAARMILYYIGAVAILFGLVPMAVRLLDVYLPVEVPGSAHWIGAGLAVIGLVTYTACAAWLMVNGRGPYVELDPPKQFVSSGPYRWCRNPVAASVLITILGEALYFASPALLGLFIVGIGLAQAQVVLIEEPLLQRRFGTEYEQYCRTVPRWLPWGRPRVST